ncbi:MAG: YabP/YqfC family sporulation protein [Candidatus Onthoplasma sp.]
MNMFEEIEKFMQSGGATATFRIVNLGGTSLYIEGIKSIVSIEKHEICLGLKKQLLIVSGENLTIKYLDKTTCLILGSIYKVETK